MTTITGPVKLPAPINFRKTVRPVRGISPGEASYVGSVKKQLAGLQANMQILIDAMDGATPGAIVYALQPVYDLSQELVPVDTGDLKDSGFLEGRGTRGSASAVVGYGKGGHPTYAALVHERLDFRHASGKQAKFLEEAINQKFGDFGRRLKLYYTKLIPAFRSSTTGRFVSEGTPGAVDAF